jgi:Uma2 family endonuclease
METIIENLINSPKLGIYLKQINDILSKEQLKRQDFYSKIKEDDKVEFINGEMVFHSPVKLQHNLSSFYLSKLLGTFADRNDLGIVCHEKIMISLSRNDYEPDIVFFKKEKSDNFTPKQMRFPAPDLVVEVLSESTEKIDRGIKFEDYAIHGVAEYWIIDPDLQIIEQYILKNEKYELLMKSGSGMLKSQVLNGFDIPVQSIFDKDENLKALQKILL